VAAVAGDCPLVPPVVGPQATGMVFVGGTSFPAVPNGSDIGNGATRYTVYALNGPITLLQKNFYGTLVAEGDGSTGNCTGANQDVQVKSNALVWTGPGGASQPLPAGGVWGANQYGYPLAILIYDPELADPTITPTYAPQDTCADLGAAGDNSIIRGIVYSGGHVQFNPLSVDGGIVAFEIQTQGSAGYSYNLEYGNASPPAGFPVGSGNLVVVIRKSFIVCSTYSDETAAATVCP
ncbi:MAG: hypothetical protein ACRDHK_08195, partial [Actinomycetota bacterium]